MKKVFVLGVIFSAFLFASCGGIDSKLNALEKACESGDLQKIAKATADLDECKNELTEEQSMRLLKISGKCAEKSFNY